MKTTEILIENQTSIQAAIESRPAARGMGTEDYQQLIAMKAVRANVTTLGEVMGIVDATMAPK